LRKNGKGELFNRLEPNKKNHGNRKNKQFKTYLKRVQRSRSLGFREKRSETWERERIGCYKYLKAFFALNIQEAFDCVQNQNLPGIKNQ
jgi:hypothetical protein